MKIEIYYPDKRVETHRGIKGVTFEKNGEVMFSRSTSPKLKRKVYHLYRWNFDSIVIKEEENDGGSKNKD